MSTATVSRTLKLPDLVSSATRAKVMDAVATVNYTPNVMARNLRTRDTKTVILVVRDIANPFYLEIFRGVEEQAHELGYSVLMGNTRNDASREKMYFEMVDGRQADGIILMTGLLGKDDFKAREAWPPMVVALEYVPGFQFPTIQIDNERAAAKAVEYLVSLGHRRIAHISGPASDILSIDRFTGYKKAMENAGLPYDSETFYQGDYSIDSGHRAIRKFIKTALKPTAIFCSNDEMAMGAINELRTEGYKVPKDISVIGFDDITFSAEFYPALTTVRQRRSEIGQQAMKTLAEILRGAEVSPEPVFIGTELIVRDSTGSRAE